MRIADSHFHTQIMIQRGLDAGLSLSFIAGGIDAGCKCDDIALRKELLLPFPHIKLAGAMGPWCADGLGMEQIEDSVAELERAVTENNAAFVGEIGLDYHWNYGTPEIQKHLFIRQMELAVRLGMRVLVHSREAADDTAAIIRQYSGKRAGVIHCFEGSQKILEAALDSGYWISFAGNLTYKSNENLRDALRLVPRNRLLLETDSPYLSPVPLRGQPNSPCNIVHTYRCAADVLGIEVEELAGQIWENFTEFCA